MASSVYLHRVTADPSALAPPDIMSGLTALGAALGLGAAQPRRAVANWAVKISLGAPHRPAAIAPAWADVVADLLPGRRAFFWDTLSITTAGLDRPGPHRELAAAKGFGRQGARPFAVADAPDSGPRLPVPTARDSDLTDHALAGGLAGADGLCLLTPIRPHPHLGFRGAVATLGLGTADREAEIAMHRDLRPQVDTPLCAGCGVCMTVCIFDAILLKSGRATIDHTRCTGCGECMNVCFMAGIAPEDAAGIPRFQKRVADAAVAARDRVTAGVSGRAVYFNFLLGLDRHAGGGRRRERGGPVDLGVAASLDPVALDQATWDLISDADGAGLASWSGFKQLPEALLARAMTAGLGDRTYELVTV